MGADKFQETVNKVLIAKTKRDLVEQRMNEAYEDAGYSAQTDLDAEKKFLNTTHTGAVGQSISGADMVAAISKLYGEDLDYETAIERINLLQKKANAYDAVKHREGSPEYEALMALTGPGGLGQILAEEYGMGGNPLNRKEVLVDNMLKFKNKYIKERDNKLNKMFKKSTKTDFKNVINFAPIDGHANHDETKKALKEVFDAGFPQGITFIDPKGGGNLDLKTYFEEVLDMDVENFEIVTDGIGLANVSRADGTSVLVIPVRDKTTGLQKNTLVDASAVGTGGYLESWINSAEYQMEVLWKAGEHAQVNKYPPKIFDLDDTPYDDVVFDYNHPTGPSIIINGEVKSKRKGLQMLANAYANKGFAYNFQDLYNNIGK